MKESRHKVILQELDQTGVVSVKNLKELLNVTDMTIRRDLIDLEKQGLLIRVHGGAHKKVKDQRNSGGAAVSQSGRRSSHCHAKRGQTLGTPDSAR